MDGVKCAVGVMSGTSMDGIDVAMIETDGEDTVRRGKAATFAYDAGMRAGLAQAMAAARDLSDRASRPGAMADTERRFTEAAAAAVAQFLAEAGLARDAIDVIGFHGQTVLHRPDIGLTMQLGDGALLSRLTGVPVVYDLRADDMAAGGQGAPLVPVYHRAMAAALPQRPLGVLNVGGVANLTWIGSAGDLVAFDTGPGGALIDDWVARCSNGQRGYDEGGQLAAAGTVREDVVAFFIGHDYFARPPPKSLDRNTFFWDLVEWMTPEDGAATLTAMTAEAVAKGLGHLPAMPLRIIACGGGRKNATLMAMLRARTGIAVERAEAAGFDGDSVEAEAWAYLAVRSQRGLPITFPGTTGVDRPLSGGIKVG